MTLFSGSTGAVRSLVVEAHFVVADPEDVTVGDSLTGDALTVVFDTVRGAHIDHVVLAVEELDHGVLSRHIGIFDGEVAALLAASDDEAVFVHDAALALVPNN